MYTAGIYVMKDSLHTVRACLQQIGQQRRALEGRGGALSSPRHVGDHVDSLLKLETRVEWEYSVRCYDPSRLFSSLPM